MVQFASYLRRVLCKTRLIFPRINGPNVYCIHIEKKTSAVFLKAIRQAIIRCLPNVFIAGNSVDVSRGHITVVEALLKSQLNGNITLV